MPTVQSPKHNSGFQLIRHSDLPQQARFQGRTPDKPIVRVNLDAGVIYFSKVVRVALDYRTTAACYWNPETQVLIVRGVIPEDMPHLRLEEEDLFPIKSQHKSGKHVSASIAIKRLLKLLDLNGSVGSGECKIVAIDGTNHSVSFQFPQVSESDPHDDQAET